MSVGSLPDLLRLVVVPVIGWAAWRDVRTRRVSNRLWPPLGALGVVLLAVEAAGHLPVTTVADRLFLVRSAASVGIVVPLAYVFWRLGGFGGADAKALMTLAVLVPTYPTYYLPTVALPVVRTTLGVFSLTVLTNTVVVGLAYPVALGVRNAVDGDVAPAMVLARRVPVTRVTERHGRLFETTTGTTRSGLDLDALRMYLRWRGTTLATLRESPDEYRDPASVGETSEVGDGAVDPEVATDGGEPNGNETEGDEGDPWAAERFLADIEGNAYGTTPETLREGLEVLTDRDRERVWVSPGIPFLVPTFGGLVVAFTYGDLLFAVLTAVGAV